MTGVIEKDIALNTGDAPAEKFLQGKSAAIIISGGSGNKYDTAGRCWKEVHGTEFLDDVKLLKLMPDVKGNKAYPVWGYAWSESYSNASVSDEKLDKILKLYDYLLSDEGSLFSTYGPEGELYDLVDGKVVMHDDEVLVKDVYPSCDGLGVLARWNPSTYDDRFVSAFPAEYTELDHKQVEEAATVKVPEIYTSVVMEKINITVYPYREQKKQGNLFGIFFEDLNHAADGGLYGELIQNRFLAFQQQIQTGGMAVQCQQACGLRNGLFGRKGGFHFPQ